MDDERFWITEKPKEAFDVAKRGELRYNDEKKLIGVQVELIQLNERGNPCVLSGCYLSTEELEILLEEIRKSEQDETRRLE